MARGPFADLSDPLPTVWVSSLSWWDPSAQLAKKNEDLKKETEQAEEYANWQMARHRWPRYTACSTPAVTDEVFTSLMSVQSCHMLDVEVYWLDTRNSSSCGEPVNQCPKSLREIRRCYDRWRGKKVLLCLNLESQIHNSEEFQVGEVKRRRRKGICDFCAVQSQLELQAFGGQ